MSSDPSASPARADGWLSAVFFVGFAAMTIVATTYPAIARAMPMLVGTLGMVLSAIQFVRTVSGRRDSAPRETTADSSGHFLMFAWLIAAVALVGLLGILAGGALFVVLFLRARLAEAWWSAIPSGLVLSTVALKLGRAVGLEIA